MQASKEFGLYFVEQICRSGYNGMAMGQALYRKYRSRSLAEVVGQEHITKVLEHALKSGNISHAYLLTGPRGVGKTSVARIIAHAVNNLPYKDESGHLDIIEIDAASHRRIDEIRELRERVHIAPASAKYKVYIIDEVHMLTKEAFNALLKTLEEPPAHVIFILATTDSHKLPATIISRTQRLSFRPVETSKVISHLKNIAGAEKISIDDEALALIARYGGGSFRDSISLLDQVRNRQKRVKVADILLATGQAPEEMINNLEQAIKTGSVSQAIQALNTMREQGYEPAILAAQLGERIRSHLSESQNILPLDLSLRLLAAIIEVPASPNPSMALEIAILECILPAENSGSAKTAAPPAGSVVSPPKISKKSGQKSKTGPSQEAVWPELLQSIKQSHNTLYSVLRLAQPSWDDTQLTLTFGFAFHQKRVNEPANRQIIIDALDELTGRNITLNCEVDPGLNKSSPKIVSKNVSPANGDTPLMESISNIFGGAELIET